LRIQLSYVSSSGNPSRRYARWQLCRQYHHYQQARGKFLEGTATAEVPQPTTVYAFAGQDSQEQGTEMGLFYSSPAARVVCLC
jgi:hypothetical protein